MPYRSAPEQPSFVDSWAQAVINACAVEPPAPKKLSPSPLEIARTILGIKKPWCRRCRRGVADAVVVSRPDFDVLHVAVWCHSEASSFEVSGYEVASAGGDPVKLSDLFCCKVFGAPIYERRLVARDDVCRYLDDGWQHAVEFGNFEPSAHRITHALMLREIRP